MTRKDQLSNVHGWHQTICKNLFAKVGKQLETVMHTVRIYSQYIDMEFSIEKRTMLVMKNGK